MSDRRPVPDDARALRALVAAVLGGGRAALLRLLRRRRGAALLGRICGIGQFTAPFLALIRVWFLIHPCSLLLT